MELETGAVAEQTAAVTRATGKRSDRRRGAGRWRRGAFGALIAGAVVLPLAGAARPAVPAPAPASLAPLTASTLDAAYMANRANAAEASRMAAADGNDERAAADRSMADPSRRFLSFDGRGPGQATEVFGDLAHADRVAVLVPGSDTSVDTYDRFRAGALALHERLVREAPEGVRTAVVAWLGYRTPDTVSATVLTAGRAEQAAPRLREFIGELRRTAGPNADISLLCHSYGTVVCGRAAAGLDVSDIALVGSPGTGADSAAALHTPARVWAARGGDDWIAEVPHVEADLFGTTVGFGTDPVSPAFGAHVFAAGSGGHSDYFRPGSASLANLTRIVLGDTKAVTRA
ncbi:MULTISPECIES: alpha/beta hydrolase [unclassified Streptomyces]|uniref:alpha/beta hydrolase n=1 Tax=unclassified Streptomyces TaxID=2593676 RepID=UPI00224FE392|nr:MULTISPECIES: alpha/beta hydrolase [unclassified Streptomyces]MCX5060277.1 alpha/beta hydrolase family protein [Streptomyces sp. NBC_00452]MCX5286431.1 alpha/beta hydrolase family protein [Streptomyces sp. NBC_00183]